MAVVSHNDLNEILYDRFYIFPKSSPIIVRTFNRVRRIILKNLFIKVFSFIHSCIKMVPSRCIERSFK